MHSSVDGSGPVETYFFLERNIGAKCLASLLGIGSNRLRRNNQLTPDLRCGKAKGGSRKDTQSVDAFLSILWESVAETLPDRLVLVLH